MKNHSEIVQIDVPLFVVPLSTNRTAGLKDDNNSIVTMLAITMIGISRSRRAVKVGSDNMNLSLNADCF